MANIYINYDRFVSNTENFTSQYQLFGSPVFTNMNVVRNPRVEVGNSAKVVMRFKANEGYRIKTAEYKIGGSGKYTPLVTMLLESDGYYYGTAQLATNLVMVYIETEPYIEPEPEVKTVQVYIDGSNFTIQANDPKYNVEINVPITVDYDDTTEFYIVANEGYIFSRIVGVSDSPDPAPDETLINNKKFTINNISGDVRYTVYTILEPEPEPEPEPDRKTKTISVEGEGEGYTVILSNVDENIQLPIYEEIKYNPDGAKLFIQADEGYKITVAYLGGSPTPNQQFDISGDGTNATIILTGSHTIAYVEVVFIGGVDDLPVQEVDNFNNIYVVDMPKMRKITGAFFGLEGETKKDISPFIINLLRLPFKINSNVITDSEKVIRIGDVLLPDVKALMLRTDFIELNLGEIVVGKKYGNSYDYLNTSCLLHLPYSDSVTLDNDYVIGETIKIIYLVDVYTGDCTINVYSSKINDVFFSVNTQLGENIPFIQKSNSGVNNNSVTNKKFLNNRLNYSYLEISRNEPYQTENNLLANGSIETKLINETGFLKVEDIILQSKATAQEKSEIVSILNRGVFINE